MNAYTSAHVPFTTLRWRKDPTSAPTLASALERVRCELAERRSDD